MGGYRRRAARRGVRATARYAGLALFVLGFLAFGGTASAATGGKLTSADDQYGAAAVLKPNTAQVAVKSVVVTQKSPVAQPSTSGSLPSTGISLAGTVVVGLGLVGVGIVLRRRGDRQE